MSMPSGRSLGRGMNTASGDPPADAAATQARASFAVGLSDAQTQLDLDSGGRSADVAGEPDYTASVCQGMAEITALATISGLVLIIAVGVFAVTVKIATYKALRHG
jgi:hypothetical protein